MGGGLTPIPFNKLFLQFFHLTCFFRRAKDGRGLWKGTLGRGEGGGGGGQQPMPSTFTTQSGTDGRQADGDHGDSDDDGDGDSDDDGDGDGNVWSVGICRNWRKLSCHKIP